jgi:hydrogenase expression/formation protein HypC
MAVIDVDGVRRECSLLLVEDAREGEYVIVHAGFAIARLDVVEAEKSLALFAEIAAALGPPRALHS